VEVVDDYPASVLAHARRQHRWVRGDWQILRWLFPWVPSRAGLTRNRLPLISRWKIFDNLRRSLWRFHPAPAAARGRVDAGPPWRLPFPLCPSSHPPRAEPGNPARASRGGGKTRTASPGVCSSPSCPAGLAGAHAIVLTLVPLGRPRRRCGWGTAGQRGVRRGAPTVGFPLR
jgi:hypothetical protein